MKPRIKISNQYKTLSKRINSSEQERAEVKFICRTWDRRPVYGPTMRAAYDKWLREPKRTGWLSI